MTFSSAVYCGNRLNDWNTMPKCRRFLRICASLLVVWSAASSSVSPFTMILPSFGVSRKFRQRSSVVLPEPDEPMMASALPRSNVKLMSLSTLVEPKFL